MTQAGEKLIRAARDARVKTSHPKPPWCTRHRGGWCMIKPGTEINEDTDIVPTACGHFVTLPWGFERRDPDCPECLEARRSGK